MVDELMTETLRRYPSQGLMLAEAVPEYRKDWLAIAEEKGWARFSDAVIKARRECQFFPLPADILARITDPQPRGSEAVLVEMRELQARKKAGEKFYGLTDLAREIRKLTEKKTIQ